MPKSKTPPKSKSTAKSTAPSDGPPQPSSQAANFARFLPAAKKIASERVMPCRIDVNLIFANVQTGTAAVLPYLERLKTELPMVDVAQFEELLPLAGALLYATAQTAVSATPIKRAQMNQMLVRLRALREPMLLCAEAFALLGLIPMQRVKQIRSGQGAFDTARDGVALADLYAEFATVLAAKHPFSSAQLTEIAELGHTLLGVITPNGARATPSPALVAATEARDRLFSLLRDRHDELRRAGTYLFGKQVNQKVPLLGARKGHGKSESASPAPAMPSAPANPTPSASAQP